MQRGQLQEPSSCCSSCSPPPPPDLINVLVGTSHDQRVEWHGYAYAAAFFLTNFLADVCYQRCIVTSNQSTMRVPISLNTFHLVVIAFLSTPFSLLLDVSILLFFPFSISHSSLSLSHFLDDYKWSSFTRHFTSQSLFLDD